jgi:apolipoprotein N-acyltransferase
MLCYEDMIPEAARSLVAESATVLVSLINGAAFTEPLTLAQHRLLAQLRAVENRRAFVRCAATGETCVISPTGRIIARLPVHVQESLVATVPLLKSRTLSSRTGTVFPAACAVGLVVLARRSRGTLDDPAC